MSDTKTNQLIEAAREGHLAVVAALLAAGANVHAEDDAALRWAADHGHVDGG